MRTRSYVLRGFAPSAPTAAAPPACTAPDSGLGRRRMLERQTAITILPYWPSPVCPGSMSVGRTMRAANRIAMPAGRPSPPLIGIGPSGPDACPGRRSRTRRGDLPAARVCYRSPHRLRLRIPSRRGDAAFFDRVKDGFATGVVFNRPEVNAVTGSILFNAAVDVEMVGLYAEALGLFALAGKPQAAARPGCRRARAPQSGQAVLFICRPAVNLLRVLIYDLLVCREPAIVIQARMVFRI